MNSFAPIKPLVKHEYFSRYLTTVDKDSVFVEIGGERGEGSTDFLASLAKTWSVRLLSVDLEPKNLDYQMSKQWMKFYQTIRDPSWPEHCAHINDLPTHLQNECIDTHHWNETVDWVKQIYGKEANLDLVDFFCAKGSDWTRDYQVHSGKKISLLYLDNFDVIRDLNSIPDMIQKQIEEYRTCYQIEMNNQNCQVEHLSQLVNLYPYFAQDCLVGFDDTWRYNDFWIGKCGPGVVFLLSKNWRIIHDKSGFVIMQKPQENGG